MDEDEPPLIEVIGDDDDEAGAGAEDVSRDRWHTVVRTAAAVIGAVALLWAGSSLAGLRANSDHERCRAEVDNLRFAYEQLAYEAGDLSSMGRADIADADAERVIEMARGCGLDDYAETLERLYAEPEDDDAE